MKLSSKINPLNLAHWICEHIMGKEHTHAHRIIVGIVIMFLGVITSKLGTASVILHYIADCAGYFIHGVGAIPIVEYLIAQSNQAGSE